MDDYATEIRRCLDWLGISQREAARRLECDERDFRYWCAGRPCPRMVPLAMQSMCREAAAVTGEAWPFDSVKETEASHER